MSVIGQYLLGVTATAMIGGIAVSICGQKSSYGVLIRLICGLLLALAVVSPLVTLDLSAFHDWSDSIRDEADAFITKGIRAAEEEEQSIIKSKLEAYILDKAASLNLDISAEVTVGSTDPPVPLSVSLWGNASPYAKVQMQQYLTNELAIPEEYQQWN